MIGRLRGIVLEKQAPDVLLEVGGVGYEVQLPLTSFYQLPETGQEVVLYTHFVVREDAQLLYGFHSATERALFRQLIKANGVGPKLALTILSGLTADDFVRCVQLDDLSTLVKLPGIGKKTAERLLVEMRDRLKDWGMAPADSAFSSLQLKPVAVSLTASEQAEQDALGALVSLGYTQQQASKAVQQVKTDDMSSEMLIKAALRSMM
ncbi:MULTISPECIES: Holliday junction branch migration protein RuvA [Alkalimonas]|uniref:Holliday junction branch migration complex subunit RuvA n=2 Tax=Alkalimonas TaxID=265980 RepID=A0ABU7J0H9_9GAMM|nr:MULTISPECIES: Holliday junction branch migration protein RuvA [unclassified Alkalimonas]MEE2000011.1 Holliday junction branch migration protein RuvA [Alkalimonas sp. MEB108]MEE2025011.1 Holliday junction branch migration protein RuvA [Alkalimonas sp. MEB004]